MKISAKGRYSLRILLDLAQHRDGSYVPLKEIAERQGISKNYLDQIMMILNRGDYLETARGAQGGYKLAKEPKNYTLGALLRLTEGGIEPLICPDGEDDDCGRAQQCAARKAWQGLGKVMSDYLDNLSLQDILDEYEDSLLEEDVQEPVFS